MDAEDAFRSSSLSEIAAEHAISAEDSRANKESISERADAKAASAFTERSVASSTRDVATASTAAAASAIRSAPSRAASSAAAVILATASEPLLHDEGGGENSRRRAGDIGEREKSDEGEINLAASPFARAIASSAFLTAAEALLRAVKAFHSDRMHRN
jgi:hypothetical protein